MPLGTSDVRQALERLRRYVEREGFQGYDPYDTLNSVLPIRRFGKWIPILAIQFQKRNPLNIRPLLGIRKDYNAKGVGLLLEAYSVLADVDDDSPAGNTASELCDWLTQHTSKGYSGACWGYNFEWASPEKVVPSGTPSAVVTGFVVRGLHEYHRVTGDANARAAILGAADFVLNDLHRTDLDGGLVFSYTPLGPDICYNASLLAAEVLARAWAVGGSESCIELARRAARFVVGRQLEDGRWNYSLDRTTKKERSQIDFHQGFVLDSLAAIELCDSKGGQASYADAIGRGLDFYRSQQFTDEGRALWRLPKAWPVDIHNQAQGIITFSKHAPGTDLLSDAKRIAAWTLANMQSEEGFFYYRIHRLYENKIPYMRWGQAWMMVALTRLYAAMRGEN